MKRNQILAAYTVQGDRIVSPGKFEGEPVFAPVLWDLALQGFADGDDGSTYRFSIPRNDPLRAEFPELNKWLGRRRTVRLAEDSVGFVRCF